MSLLSNAELAAIQAVGQLGMTATVSIYETTLTENDYGSQLTYATTASSTVSGWLVGNWARSRDDDVGDVGSTTNYRLRLPVGTEIEAGWTVQISGHEYLVEDAGTDQTWPEWLTCTVRRN
jgi:hypothetical protein